MRLKRLEIYGFKSFPSRTVIVFNQGITGIVGPNGSGKSNIGDAVRWVLGEQSARTLRGSKMEDIIFGGTQKRNAMSFCEVTLAFDNEDGALPLAFAEVAITRRAFRSGDSEYLINQSSCRLKDIVDLFRDTGIGREGYSLIGQGRIDEILSLKSEDRRQVFEEAAGISRYRARKADAERSLQRTRDNMDRTQDIIKELEDRLGPLETQAAKAREHAVLSSELKGLDLNLFIIKYERLKTRINGLKTACGETQDALTRVEAALHERTRERDESAEAAAQLDEEAALARTALNDAQQVCADLQGECERLRERISGAGEQKQRLTYEIQAAQDDLHRRENDAGSDAQAIEACQNELDALRHALQTAELNWADAQSAADTAEATLNEHRDNVLKAINRMGDLAAARARSEAMQQQMETRQAEIQALFDRLTEGRTVLADAAQCAQQNLTATQEGLTALRAAADRKQLELKELEQASRAQSTALQEMNARLRGDESRLRLLGEMAASLEGYNQAVRKAISFGGSDPRVRGVLARLIHVRRDLETAIDMALGGALQNIVTDDQETAKRLIDYLRDNRLGRATFLPIQSIRGRVLTSLERQLLQMPGCLGVASELIDYDPEYREIIESLLGRTVVARNLNSGIPIMNAGRHAFRLVTLDGDVMHSGGSMTGGTTASRTVTLLGREREMDELNGSVREQREQLLHAQKTLADLMSRHDACEAELQKARSDTHEEDIAVARDTAAFERARDALSAHDQQLEQARGALEQLHDSLQAIGDELKRLSDNSGDQALDREAMDRKSDELTRALAKARAAADVKREEATKAQLALGESQHAMQDLNRAAQRQQQEREEARGRIEKMKADLDAHDARTAEAEQSHTLRRQELDAQNAVRDEADAQVKRVEALRRARQQTITACSQAMDVLHAENAEHSDRLHKLELTQSRAEGELESLCAYIHNLYELTYADALTYRSDDKFDMAPAERRAAELRAAIRKLGPVSSATIDEYAETRARYDDLVAQRNDMQKAEDDLTQLIHRLLSRMEKQFTEQFAIMNTFFGETFTRLFGGGQAELKLNDPNDALECGIDIVAQPPGKKLQMLSLLSGGERALTAIAILFAMLKLKPTPFCILDEIEAALDEANIHYFADYLAEYARTTQFVVVTHRKGTMERCDALYGVAMQEQGVSGMVSVDLKDYE